MSQRCNDDVVLDSLFALETDLSAEDDVTESTHQLKGDIELVQLTGQQVEPLHLDKVGPYTVTTSLEILV